MNPEKINKDVMKSLQKSAWFKRLEKIGMIIGLLRLKEMADKGRAGIKRDAVDL